MTGESPFKPMNLADALGESALEVVALPPEPDRAGVGAPVHGADVVAERVGVGSGTHPDEQE
jgi:hypothetical protein